MLAADTSAPGYVLLVIAALGSLTTIVVAVINSRRTKGVREEATAANEQATAANTQAISNETVAREVAAEVIRQLDTGNGHTIGYEVGRAKEQNQEILTRIDDVEVIAREGLEVAREGIEQTEVVGMIATEARDHAAVTADALQVHLADIADDRQFLSRIKDDWDVMKDRVMGERDKRTKT